jgi:hypothetical protein
VARLEGMARLGVKHISGLDLTIPNINYNGPSIQVAGTPQEYLQPQDGESSKRTLQIPISDVVNTAKVDINERSKVRVVGRLGPQPRKRLAVANNNRNAQS